MSKVRTPSHTLTWRPIMAPTGTMSVHHDCYTVRQSAHRVLRRRGTQAQFRSARHAAHRTCCPVVPSCAVGAIIMMFPVPGVLSHADADSRAALRFCNISRARSAESPRRFPLRGGLRERDLERPISH